MRMFARKFIVVVFVLLGILLAGTRPRLSAHAGMAHPWLLLQTKYHCIFGTEDIEWTAKGKYYTGLENMRMPPPPPSL